MTMRWVWILTGVILAFWGQVLFALDETRLVNATTVEVTILEGSSAMDIAYTLSDQGVIAQPLAFYGYLKLSGAGKNLRAGTYRMSPYFSMARIAGILQEKEGPASVIRVTIPEGYTLSEIAAVLDRHKVVDRKVFLRYVKTQGRDELRGRFPFLADVPTRNLEGYLFPDTYIFSENQSPESVLTAFLRQFEAKILPIWGQSKTPYSLHQMLTLASIIERETYDRSESQLVSGVFHNRLRRGIPLASCPTVSYAMGQPHKLNLTYADLKYRSPYNTYQHAGLPPTPIAAPGVQAFEAAVKPAKTVYLFFVANGDGTHRFSTNLSQHLQSQQEILRKARLRNRS